MAIYRQDVSQTLAFISTYRHNQKIQAITQALAFAQMDTGRDNHEFLSHTFVVNQTVRYTISGTRRITQTLSFTDHGYRSVVGDVYQNLNFTESASPGNKWPLIDQSIFFHETIVAARATGASHLLTFAQTVAQKLNRVRLISQSLAFGSSATGYKPTVDYISDVPPTTVTHGSTSYVITPPSVPYIQPTVRFDYDSGASGRGIISIVLKRPEFGNKDTLEMRRIQRETRNGDLIIYRDAGWSASQVLEMNFTFMDDVETRALQDYIRGTMGQLIVFTDHENKAWLGIFNSPDFEITTPGRFNNSFTVKFEVIFA